MMDYQAYLKTTGKYEEPAKVEPKEEPKKEIDWEQRRYEIAKQMMPFCAPKWFHNINLMKEDKCAQAAVKYADALIEELKKTSK